MEANEKAHLAIWKMYCQKHGLNADSRNVTTVGHDKVDRHKVDDHLFETRVKDVDPFSVGE